MVKIVRKQHKPHYRIVRKQKPKASFFTRVKKGFRNLLLIVLIGVIAISAVMIKKVNSSLDKLNQVPIGKTLDELMISSEAYNAQKSYNIENIAVFGKDIEDDDGYKRSDTIMILSVNKQRKQTSLVSIQRDSFVNIPEYGLNKINTAYFFGDAALAVKTINSNLDMDIQYYVSVDMTALIDIVDAIGGIQLNITPTELDEFNLYVDDINYTFGEPYSAKFETAGTYLCDGRQAMVYSRIRKIGNSDFDRTARQRIVLSQIYDKIKTELDITMLLDIASALSEHIQTNIPKSKLLNIALKVLECENGFETYSLCDEEYIRSAYVDGMQCLIPYYLEDMAKDLHEKIYGEDFLYTPSEEVMNSSDKIKDLIYNYDITLEKIYTGDTL